MKAVNKLFNLQNGEALTLNDRMRILNQVEEHLKTARTDESAYLSKPLVLKKIQDANQQVDRVMELLIKVRGPVEPNLLAMLTSQGQIAETTIENNTASETISGMEEDDDEFFDALDTPYNPTIDDLPVAIDGEDKEIKILQPMKPGTWKKRTSCFQTLSQAMHRCLANLYFPDLRKVFLIQSSGVSGPQYLR